MLFFFILCNCRILKTLLAELIEKTVENPKAHAKLLLRRWVDLSFKTKCAECQDEYFLSWTLDENKMHFETIYEFGIFLFCSCRHSLECIWSMTDLKTYEGGVLICICFLSFLWLLHFTFLLLFLQCLYFCFDFSCENIEHSLFACHSSGMSLWLRRCSPIGLHSCCINSWRWVECALTLISGNGGFKGYIGRSRSDSYLSLVSSYLVRPPL